MKTMRLRRLEMKDAELMLEWMHDDDVVHDLNRDFSNMTIYNCEDFIKNAFSNDSIHMAIVNDRDEYMGTVSLKNIDFDKHAAEFGIAIRKCAMGKGYAIWAMREMFESAKDHGIKRIFWCVSPKNHRALRFYDKHKFDRVDFKMINIGEDDIDYRTKELVWYLHEI